MSGQELRQVEVALSIEPENFTTIEATSMLHEFLIWIAASAFSVERHGCLNGHCKRIERNRDREPLTSKFSA